MIREMQADAAGKDDPIHATEYERHMSYVLKTILDAGELLLTCGAEVNRVEDTIMRLAAAFGFVKTDVFTITSSILVTVELSDGVSLTQSRRIRSTSTELKKVEEVNALSRRICGGEADIGLMQRELARIRQLKGVPVRTQCIMYAIISGVFSVYFGGTLRDGIASALTGILLFALMKMSDKLELTGVMQRIMVSVLTAFVVMLSVKAGLGVSPDKIMIGNIMLLVPGIQLTTSFRDMIAGDLITGTLNLCEALVKATAIAAGFAFVVGRMGG